MFDSTIYADRMEALPKADGRSAFYYILQSMCLSVSLKIEYGLGRVCLGLQKKKYVIMYLLLKA